MSENKQQYLMTFRKCSTFVTLDIVYERLNEKYGRANMMELSGAYDHRKAELTMQRLYDKVPASVWAFVR
ncbi:hypothetical protein I7V28_19600 [Lelliottia amnigena]|uniref:Hha/YmoA family nucleoid-associated regulatory protein n=1 Tax=Lelliottia TaxID=1330545 RepID=UPI00192C4C10|nr:MULTISPECIES: Hha/YmoA family nucleoid-associated regulatory protein [Lelliottia]MBL5885709.1 hypothetical protein [Lelliottia aquatilis]MBL5923288.1 hypothetical protein [Lelliottia amnigena]MBL5932197.1 hypothetical protein [Lelliottia amnigena]